MSLALAAAARPSALHGVPLETATMPLNPSVELPAEKSCGAGGDEFDGDEGGVEEDSEDDWGKCSWFTALLRVERWSSMTSH